MVDIPSAPLLAETGLWAAGVHELQNGWRPTGGPVNPAADGGLLNWPLLDLANRTGFLKAQTDALMRMAGRTVTVGAGGDFTTINAALEELSRDRMLYISGGSGAVVRLLPGFVMSEQIWVAGVNLGHISIVGDDPQTTINRAALTTLVNQGYSAFAATDGGTLPVIDQLFQMNTAGAAADRYGMEIYSNASATFRSGSGIKGAQGKAVMVYAGGSLSAAGAIFSNTTGLGVEAGGGTRVALQNADLRNNTGGGLDANNGASVQAGAAICTGCGGFGVKARSGAIINASGANCRIGGGNSPSDIGVYGGGIIAATSAIGGASQPVNAVSANGIIFQ